MRTSVDMPPLHVILFLLLGLSSSIIRAQTTDSEKIINEIRRIAEEVSNSKTEFLTKVEEFKEELRQEVRRMLNETVDSQSVADDLATFKHLLDTDECKELTHNCSTDAVCVDTRVAFRCICKPGMTGDGYTCEDFDECEAGMDENCGPNSSCRNTPGAYECDCYEGYEKNGNGTCEDVNECLTSNKCHPFAICENLPGGYNCTCSIFHDGDGYECEEIGDVNCSHPFDFVPGVGCLKIVRTERSFEESRRHCQSLGGDLFVALNKDHYIRLAQHYIDTNQRADEKYMWVGVKEGQWLSGRWVDPEEEAPRNPDMGKGTCSYTDGDVSERFLLWTGSCGSYWESLCEQKHSVFESSKNGTLF